MRRTWTIINQATGKQAPGQRPFPSRKRAFESAARVNAFRVALGLKPTLIVAEVF